MANLHYDLMAQLLAPSSSLAPQTSLYAAAYRPIRREEKEEIDLWTATLALGQALPVLPLALNWELCLPVDLEATYMDACRRRRLI